MSGRIWGRLGRWWPWGAVHEGTGGSGKRSLAHLARVGETLDWLAGEDDVRGVPATGHAIRKGVAGRAAGRGRQWPAHPRANRWGDAGRRSAADPAISPRSRSHRLAASLFIPASCRRKSNTPPLWSASKSVNVPDLGDGDVHTTGDPRVPQHSLTFWLELKRGLGSPRKCRAAATIASLQSIELPPCCILRIPLLTICGLQVHCGPLKMRLLGDP